MRSLLAKTLLTLVAWLLLVGCTAKTESTTSVTKLPWSRVTEVEVATETNAHPQAPEGSAESVGPARISPGASQSQVVLAWGVPDYILDSKDDPDRKIWQYPHAIVVFQRTKVQQILPR